MTTPEKLRRRQYREGVALILIGIFTVAQAIYFNVQDARQGQCIADKVNEITAVFSARADLADQDTTLTRRESAATSHVILAVGRIHSSAQFRAIEARYKRQTDAIAAERMAVDAQRQKHPVPDFPDGACGSSAAATMQNLNAIAARMP